MEAKKIISAIEEKNNLLRREMGLVKPDYGRWPSWLLKHIIHASKRGKIEQYIQTTSEASMHRDWGGRWLDHWGTIDYDGWELFVAEPFHLSEADEKQAIDFAKAIDMPIKIDKGMGWHAPNLTDRIIIGGRL